jgi:glycosyltransferase involved in cell wall biosynthesis
MMNKKICFVVHRYAPFPGGSEYYVQQMAEECVQRHLDVTVIAGEHKGDLNGVRVTSDLNHLRDQDLVVVHGGDVGVQDYVLSVAKHLNSPVLYMLIKPSESPNCVQALKDVAYIGCSTLEDWEHVKRWGVHNKSFKVVHGISPTDCIGEKDKFKEKYNLPKDKKMFLSCGGYWPNKRMIELALAFEKAGLEDSILVTTGYDNRHNLIPTARNNIFPLMVDDPKDVKNAIADADCYLMHSSEEGFGLVILEAMLNKTPWISRNIAGAKLLSRFGQTYETDDQLISLLKSFERDEEKVKVSYDYVVKSHLISNTVDDILKIIEL